MFLVKLSNSRSVKLFTYWAEVIPLVITIRRPRFAVTDFELERPWPDAIRWLEPFESDGVYRFEAKRGSLHEYARADVLNHRRNVRRTLARGDSLAGVLLGIGNATLPFDFRHGAMVPAFVAVCDQFSQVHRAPVSLWVDRNAAFVFHPEKRRTRRLFDCPDRGNASVRMAAGAGEEEKKM